MRASTPFLGVMIGALAACTNSAPEGDAARRAAFEAELELAILPEVAAGEAVVSELEILRPTPDAGPTPSRSAPAPSVAVIEDPRAAIVSVEQPAYHAPELPTTEAVRPVVLAGGTRDRQPSVGTVRPRGGTGVIIRGGIDERDPCVIHRPGDGLGGIGILINDPTPRDIGGVANRGPSRGVPGGISVRGGGGFIGGIR